MSDTTAAMRIRALEDALRQCVGYMKRLPLVPATAEQVRAAEGVLGAVAPPLRLVGETYSPAGFMVAGVTVEGDKATIRTTLPPHLAGNLVSAMADGVTVILRPQNQ